MLEFFTIDLWKQLWNVFAQTGLEMLIGGILLGLLAAWVSYWLSFQFITRIRARRRRRRARLTH